MMSEIKVEEHVLIEDLEVLKVLSDPTRHEIMNHVGEENKRGNYCTVKQLAKIMGVATTKLYYHIKMLEEHGLLLVGDTRVVSGIIEKQYQVVAHNISFSQNALMSHDGPKDEALEEMFKSIEQIVGGSIANLRTSLSTIYAEKRREKEGGEPARKQVSMHIERDDFLLTYAQAEEFKSRLAALLEEFRPTSDENAKNTEEMLYFEVTQMFVPQYQRKIEK